MKELVKVKTKVCLIGEAAVGKTSLIRRFVLDLFNDNYISTIGTKVTKKELKLGFENRNVDMDLTLWDIMGNRSFRQLLKESYFYGAHGIIAVCDITRNDTLADLDDWIDSVYKLVGKVPVSVLANKADLKRDAKFGDRELKAFAKGFDAPYFYSSAKTGENVEYVFKDLARTIVTAQLPYLKPESKL